MTTPNEKVFMLFLEFETTSGKRITSDTMDQAIAYVLKNYKDSDIPTLDKLRELASRYIQIPGNRTRLVVSGPYGRKVANLLVNIWTHKPQGTPTLVPLEACLCNFLATKDSNKGEGAGVWCYELGGG